MAAAYREGKLGGAPSGNGLELLPVKSKRSFLPCCGSVDFVLVRCPAILGGHLSSGWSQRQASVVTRCRELCEVPWQEFSDAADWVFRDMAKNVAQVSFRVEAVELGRADERIERGGAFPAAVRSGEEVVFASERDDAQR